MKDESKVLIKDMSSDFILKVSTLLEEIDLLKKDYFNNKRSIILINERLHSLYLKLYPKMTEEEITKQDTFRRKLSFSIGKRVRVQDRFGRLVPVFRINIKLLKKYKFIVEKREMHLNIVLERLGLTARERKGRVV